MLTSWEPANHELSKDITSAIRIPYLVGMGVNRISMLRSIRLDNFGSGGLFYLPLPLGFHCSFLGPIRLETFSYGFPENKVPLNALRLAIRTCRQLAIDYVNGEGRQTQRVIWPIQLGFMDNARVVTGWCELRQAFRFFRTDRISSAEIGDRYPARRADLVRDFHSQVRDEDSTDKSPDRN